MLVYYSSWLPIVVVLMMGAPHFGQARVGGGGASSDNPVPIWSSIQEDILALKAQHKQDMAKIEQGYQELKAENQELKMMIQVLQEEEYTLLEQEDIPNIKDNKQRALAGEPKAGLLVLFSTFKKFKNAITKEVEGLKAQLNETSRVLSTSTTKMACIDSTSDAKNLILNGCNVHVRNGLNRTNSANGYGNVILGYSEGSPNVLNRTGSHNVIVGPQHQYSSWGSIIVGSNHTVLGAYSSAIAGQNNKVTGDGSVAMAGDSNDVAGMDSATVAGAFNNVLGDEAAAVGGAENDAVAKLAVAIAGTQNIVHGFGAASVGGKHNLIETNDNDYSNRTNAFAVSVGGTGNSISGLDSVAVAGYQNNVTGFVAASVAGDFNTIAGPGAASLAGVQSSIAGDAGSAAIVAGAQNNVTAAAAAIIAGIKNNTFCDYVALRCTC